MPEADPTQLPAPESLPSLQSNRLATRILGAMSAQMATQGLRIVQQILLIPLFLNAWGIDVYTDWLLINAGVAFVSIFDGGMQPHFSGQLQERLVRGDRAGYRRAARIAGFNYLLVIAITASFAIASRFVIDWRETLGVSALRPHEFNLTLLLLGANAFITLPFGVAGSLYRANAEYDRGVLVNFALIAIQLILSLILLLLRQPITVLAMGTISASLFGWIAISIDQRVRYGPLPWGLVVPNAPELRTTVTQCLFFTAQPITTWLTIQGPLLILGHLGIPGATVAFTTARTLVGVSRQVTLQLAYPFGFELSLLMLRGDLIAFARLLESAVRIIGSIGGMLAGLIMVAGLPLSVVWLQGRVTLQPSLIAALAIPVAITAASQVYQLVLLFANRPRPIAGSVMIYAAVGLALAGILAPFFGAVGVAVGLAIGETIAMVGYLPSQIFRLVNIAGGAIQRTSMLRAALATLISYSIARIAAVLIPPTGTLQLGIVGAIWAVVAGLSFYAVLLDPAQRAFVQKRLLHRAN